MNAAAKIVSSEAEPRPHYRRRGATQLHGVDTRKGECDSTQSAYACMLFFISAVLSRGTAIADPKLLRRRRFKSSLLLKACGLRQGASADPRERRTSYGA